MEFSPLPFNSILSTAVHSPDEEMSRSYWNMWMLCVCAWRRMDLLSSLSTMWLDERQSKDFFCFFNRLLHSIEVNATFTLHGPFAFQDFSVMAFDSNYEPRRKTISRRSNFFFFFSKDGNPPLFSMLPTNPLGRGGVIFIIRPLSKKKKTATYHITS